MEIAITEHQHTKVEFDITETAITKETAMTEAAITEIAITELTIRRVIWQPFEEVIRPSPEALRG